VGEIGLGGEVRAVGQIERRLQEAAKLGFKRAVIPARSAEAARAAGIQTIPVSRIDEALDAMLPLCTKPEPKPRSARPVEPVHP